VVPSSVTQIPAASLSVPLPPPVLNTRYQLTSRIYK
jgi:hypothetical protein